MINVVESGRAANFRPKTAGFAPTMDKPLNLNFIACVLDSSSKTYRYVVSELMDCWCQIFFHAISHNIVKNEASSMEQASFWMETRKQSIKETVSVTDAIFNRSFAFVAESCHKVHELHEKNPLTLIIFFCLHADSISNLRELREEQKRFLIIL